MDLKVKDLIIIFMSLLVVLAVGYAYVLIENLIFDDILSDYIPVFGIWILRIIWTGLMVKWVCDISKDLTLKISQDDFKDYKIPDEKAPVQDY